MYSIGRANLGYGIYQFVGPSTTWIISLMTGTDVSEKFNYDDATHILTATSGTLLVYKLN